MIISLSCGFLLCKIELITAPPTLYGCFSNHETGNECGDQLKDTLNTLKLQVEIVIVKQQINQTSYHQKKKKSAFYVPWIQLQKERGDDFTQLCPDKITPRVLSSEYHTSRQRESYKEHVQRTEQKSKNLKCRIVERMEDYYEVKTWGFQ